MFNNITLHSLLSRILPKRKATYNKGLFHPNRDWKIILTSSLFFIIAVSIFNVIFFWETKRIKDPVSAGLIRTETIDRGTVRSIITTFESRRVLFEERKTSRPSLPDPTL